MERVPPAAARRLLAPAAGLPPALPRPAVRLLCCVVLRCADRMFEVRRMAVCSSGWPADTAVAALCPRLCCASSEATKSNTCRRCWGVVGLAHIIAALCHRTGRRCWRGSGGSIGTTCPSSTTSRPPSGRRTRRMRCVRYVASALRLAPCCSLQIWLALHVVRPQHPKCDNTQQTRSSSMFLLIIPGPRRATPERAGVLL